jgi:hypothetical protein
MPIHRQTLLTDLKRWVTRFENDLRAQCKELPDLDARLKGQYDLAKKAGRTALAYSVWRDDELTQSAVAWVLSGVFVRFLEDNGLLETPFLSGTGEAREAASETRAAYFSAHRTHSDDDYLRHVFTEVGRLPGMADLLDARHNALWNASISGDAAKEFIEFWRRIDPATGSLAHDFADPDWDTRFLGDLYQDLSESARKKYALLQTPDFVEEFILDRTLDPAIDTFGLKEVRMIDPTCGSGHFVLGGFRRLLRLWQAARPDLGERELAVHALNGVYGVDINPFAVAIARFRLLLEAWRFCGVRRLRHAPDFHVNLAVGDSLLHGARFDSKGKPYVIGHQTLFGGDEAAFKDELAHCFEVEDAKELHRILGQQYHAVVGNPPYITVKDKALNELYRRRYDSCAGKYALSVPFMERFFDLALAGSGDGRQLAGFTGQITANSFMKREFGKKLIKERIPTWDLTHVIDTSGAYIPGHGTPTVILFGRNVKPKSPTVRTVMGIKGEPGAPEEPAKGYVWCAIVEQVDCPGAVSEFVSTADTERAKFQKHPWSIGGGGAAEILDALATDTDFGSQIDDLGMSTYSGADDVYFAPKSMAARLLAVKWYEISLTGDDVRDFRVQSDIMCLVPYLDRKAILVSELSPRLAHHLWVHRTILQNRLSFGRTHADRGLAWHEPSMFFFDRFESNQKIGHSYVATHNHFVMLKGRYATNRHAPVIRLPADATEDDHLRLLGLLNSSAACFWMKQVFHCKGSTVDSKGARQTTVPFEDFYEFDGTKLKQFPIPTGFPLVLARELDRLAQELSTHSPEALAARDEVDAAALSRAETSAAAIRARMISLQEELDWQCYRHYGLIDAEDRLEWPEDRLDELPPLTLGERTFEIFMARQMARGTFETTWFERHKEAGSRPITEPPASWPEEYLALYFRRHDAIQKNKNLNLIERPEYKRRWNTEPWAKRQQEALRQWLLTRLETYFHDADRMVTASDEAATAAKLEQIRAVRARFAAGGEPRLATTRQLAAAAATDPKWMEAAAVYTGRPDFDVPKLVEDLVLAESVPALPADRYKAPGLRKRVEWERTWELQREEDRIDAKRESLERKIEGRIDAVLAERESDLPARIEIKRAQLDKAERDFHAEFGRDREYDPKRPYHAREGTSMDPSRGILELDLRQIARDLDSLESELSRERKSIRTNDAEIRPWLEAIDQLPKKPDIPVPPKYGSGDFAKTSYWKLRGKLDVPKERWILYPGAEGGYDTSPVIAWAGWDHAQQAQALAGYYQQAKDTWGWTPDRLVPLLAALKDLLPWLHQWHAEIDPRFRQKLSTIYEQFYQSERQSLRLTEGEIEASRMGENS